MRRWIGNTLPGATGHESGGVPEKIRRSRPDF